MATISETGNAKNVANLESLIGFCTGFGAAYNPSKESIKLPQLSALFTKSQNVMASLKAAKVVYDNATNNREMAFTPMKKLSTRIVNALAAVGAEQQTLNDAVSTNLKMQGRRASPKKIAKATKEGAVPEAIVSNSVSQQSYDSQVDNFAKLVQTVSAEPLYKPNEVELQVASLNTLLIELRAKNTEVVSATAAVSNARIERDNVLYGEISGLHDVALAVKQYVLSLFGKTSAQYKQIGGIPFTVQK